MIWQAFDHDGSYLGPVLTPDGSDEERALHNARSKYQNAHHVRRVIYRGSAEAERTDNEVTMSMCTIVEIGTPDPETGLRYRIRQGIKECSFDGLCWHGYRQSEIEQPATADLWPRHTFAIERLLSTPTAATGKPHLTARKRRATPPTPE